jgi:DNA invertase Pin-like site-specific DNA recombinase
VAIATVPRRAVIYTRLSDAKNGNSIADQEKSCRALAAQLGWEVVRVETENDLSQGRSHASAFKRRKVKLPDGRRELRVVRPGWRSVLEDLASGAADALVALDLDRVARDPRDLEDLIDVVESSSPRIPVQSVTGSLRLASNADVTTARLMVTIANQSSRDTQRRVAAARQRKAAEGTYGGGRRPFGYERDGVTIREPEATEIRKAAEDILAGVSLRAIIEGLRKRGVPTVTGASWSTRSLRDILLRARNAGIAVYQGTEVGAAAWPAVLDEGTWRAVCAALTDPGRRTSPGNAPRWLGSLIYRCGRCEGTVSVSGGRAQNPSYCCRGHTSHLRRSAGPVDDLVTKVIIARLSKPDAAALLAAPSGVDTAALAREANALRERKDELARLFASRAIDAAQLVTGTKQITADLAKAEAALEAAAPRDPLAHIAGRPDAAAVWEGLDLGRRRAIVSLLVEVTLLPGKGGRRPDGSYFDPDSVQIAWK